MAKASSPQWPLSAPCLASGGVTVLNNPHWPINFNRQLPESIEGRKRRIEKMNKYRTFWSRAGKTNAADCEEPLAS